MIGYNTFAFFIIYFGTTFVLYSLVPKKIKWIVLLTGSYIFYFISSKGNVIQILLETLIVWAAGLAINKINRQYKEKRKLAEKSSRKELKQKYTKHKCAVLFTGIAAVSAILLICKYSNFFVSTVNGIFNLSIKEVSIIQPLGISFFTLQAISYLADVYYCRCEAEKNPLRIALYLGFMLTVVEGPVARYSQLGAQLKECAPLNFHNVVNGCVRIVWGLIKKTIIADRAVLLVSAVFDNPQKYSGIQIIAAILFYTLQLYCEFSGIMDVMCGLGEMMGITLPENFNQPFFAKSINEFWTRWHISLGTWLRDYIFYPISLSKPFTSLSKKARKNFNPYYGALIPTAAALFFVWFLNGFWHGAGWKYITYGLYYYVLMMAGLFAEPLFGKICTKLKINRKSKPFTVFQAIRTFIIVNIGMLIFRAKDLKTALYMAKASLTNINFAVLVPGYKNDFGLSAGDYILIAVGTVLLITVSILKEKGIDIRAKISKMPYIAKFVLFMAMIFFVIIFGAYGEGYGVIDLIYAGF